MKQYLYLIGVLIVALFLTIFTLGGCSETDSYGTRGIPGINGTDGKDGSQGPQGQKGDTGSTGATGSQGPKGDTGNNGADGASPSVVQLCGSCVGAYPSTFPEVGLCLAGKLYGVYSANGGFLVYLPSGAYSSVGINCTCSFHVNGCSVN